MHRYLFLIPLALIIACSSTQKRGVEETATEYASYILSDLPEEAYKLLDSVSKERLEKLASTDKSGTLKPWEMLVIRPQAREKWSGAKKIKTISSDDNGKIISVGAGERKPLHIKVVREKGLWKISLPEAKNVSPTTDKDKGTSK